MSRSIIFVVKAIELLARFCPISETGYVPQGMMYVCTSDIEE